MRCNMQPPSVFPAAFAYHLVLESEPVGPLGADSSYPSVPLPIVPAMLLHPLLRSPQNFARRLRSFRRWLGSSPRPTTARLCDRSCRIARKSDRPALPSLWHTTLSAASGRFLELVDSHQSPRSRHFLRCP